MKNYIKITFVAAFAAIAGYGVYTSQKTEMMSDLALANVEALAQSEGGISQGFCRGTWNQECCVCDMVHNTYATPSGEGFIRGCSSKTGCSHY